MFGFFSRWKKAGKAVGITGGAGKLASFDKDGNVISSGYSPEDLKELPSFATGDKNKVLTVNTSGNGLVWKTPGYVPSSGTTGYVLTKTASGYAWQAPSGGGLPSSTSSDEWKVLTVGSDGTPYWEYAYDYGAGSGVGIGDVLTWLPSVDGGPHPQWQAHNYVPSGGSNGQVLTRVSGGGYDWVTPSGGGGALPAATSADQWKVLTVDSNGDPYWEYAYDYGAGAGVGIGDVLTWLPSVDGGPHPQWQAHNYVPSGGSNGQVLTWSGSTYSWETPTSGTTKYLHNVTATVYDALNDVMGRAYMSYVSTSSTASTSFGTLNAALVAAGLTGSVPATGFISAGSGLSIIDHLDRSGSSYYFAFATYPGSPDNVGIDLGSTSYFDTGVFDYVVALS